MPLHHTSTSLNGSVVDDTYCRGSPYSSLISPCRSLVETISCYDEAGRNGCNDEAGLSSCYNKAGRNSCYDEAGRIGILLRILHTGPYGTILDHTGPGETILDNTGPYKATHGSIGDHKGPYGTIEDCT